MTEELTIYESALQEENQGQNVVTDNVSDTTVKTFIASYPLILRCIGT